MSKTVKHKTADTPPSRRMPNRDVRPFFEKLAATIDEPVTELHYKSNFELLIAVILSAQATDVSVNIATQKLYPVANTPEAILALGEEGLKVYIKNIMVPRKEICVDVEVFLHLKGVERTTIDYDTRPIFSKRVFQTKL